MAIQMIRTPSRHLRQSYVEIFRYIRSGSRQRAPQLYPHHRCCTLSYNASTIQTRRASKPGTAHRHFSTVNSIDLSAIVDSAAKHHVDNAVTSFDWNELDEYDVSASDADKEIQLFGYVTTQRSGRKVDFLVVADPHLRRVIQVVCPQSTISDAYTSNAAGTTSLRPHTPVRIKGKIIKPQKLPAGMSSQSNTFETIDQYIGKVSRIGHIEIRATEVAVLNEFPEQLIAKHDTNFPPEMRHLSFRTDHNLREAIQLRSKIKQSCANFLLDRGFDDIETPVLFKSTPEGAREFIVPTRRKGLAYALPQSPQQYKQVLMASGIPRYFQFARCFRDEDMRADRQPEFTQLDMEMSFADSRAVMSTIEQLILQVVWPLVGRSDRIPVAIRRSIGDRGKTDNSDLCLPVYTYNEVMSKYGSDKPDLRLGAEIVRIDGWIPSSLTSMLTDIQEPIVEMLKIQTKTRDPAASREFMNSFMNLPSSSQFLKSAEGMAGISIYDPTKPLCGLAAFGHEAAADIEEQFVPEEGDILVALSRQNKPFAGGSTLLGNLRRELLNHALHEGFIDHPQIDSLLWVVDFPLFSPTEDDSPGQEGGAGICSTHHPFTAPKPEQDLSKLASEPLSIVGDHYDLVINGSEVGGGSRRIHHAKLQEQIFQQVLRMKPERIEDFRHLLNALKSGCPPHAGFALGFDRLLAISLDRASVRDVIAFPKYGDGDDKFVGSPSQLTASQLSTYHMRISDVTSPQPQQLVSIRA